MNEWHYCESCDSEFKVVSVSDNLDKILFCPFCSEEIEADDEEEEDTYWDDE